MHGVDLAHFAPTFRWQVHNEGSVGCLRDIGFVFCAGNQDGKVSAMRAGDKPFVSVDDPGVAFQFCFCANEGRVGACDFRFGHGEAGEFSSFAHGAQVGVFLFVRSPFHERVHIALIGGLTIDGERPKARAGCFCGDHGEFHMAEPHAAPFLRHVW